MKEVIAPVRGLSHGYQTWTVIVRPVELGRPAKNQAYDQSVALDRPELQWLGSLLEILKGKLRPEQRLLEMEYKEFSRLFTIAASVAGLDPLAPVPNQLRHGGVSHDMQEKFRTLSEAKMRGRWACDSSLRRYEKHGLLNKQLQNLRPEIVRKLTLTAARLRGVFEQNSVQQPGKRPLARDV
jgi:hypothetical protein